MGKRANQGVPKVAAKKLKVDPALAVVVDTVKKASHLPEQCSAMLASMLPFSLAIACEERSESQQRVVGMVEETLHSLKSKMEVLLAAEDSKLTDLKAIMAGLLETVREAETTLSGKKEIFQDATSSLSDAKASVSVSSEAMVERQSALAKSEANLASVQADKAALDDAFQAHFRMPMEAGDAPHYKELEPFLETVEMEQSMRSTLPGTCAKNKESRGSFDDVILEQLEKAIVGKVALLAETVAAESAIVAECTAAVGEAEAECTSKKEIENSATVAFEGAQKEQGEAEATFVEANEAVDKFRPQLEEHTGLCEFGQGKLDKFESGPMANFLNYKTRTEHAEAAPLGA